MNSNVNTRRGGKRNKKRVGQRESEEPAGAVVENNNSSDDVEVVDLDSDEYETAKTGDESTSSNESCNTAILNKPNESQNTLEEISSEDEDLEKEDESVVNASLIVNLSNANISVVENESLVSPKRNVKVIVNQSNEEERVLVDPQLSPVHSTGDTHTNLSPIKSPPGKSPVGKSPQSPPDEDVASEDSTLADSEVENLMMNTVKELPNTVTLLKAPNGVDVYVVGTAHFSHQSQLDVINTIQLTQPTLVLLELCSSRRNILSLDEETVLKEVSEMNFQKIRLALANSGTVQGTLHLLLLSMSAQLTRKLGMAPGGEFRAAMREARNIPGCVLLLGDRPFNITISRALSALTFGQKVKLAWQFLTSNEDITKEEIEKCKEKDLLERMLSEMTGEFPSITEVFVNERDVYLAHSLFLAATSDAHRNNGGPVVGVVGMGHVPGIVKNWNKTTEEQVNLLDKIPETPISSIIIRKTIKFSLYAITGFLVFKAGRSIILRTGLNDKIQPGIQALRDIVINRKL
ncbi:unnamed protein product [Orchesella dallaii]|uniref:TraB domain-containing protein n=1 Tax=Orchesella dallaii TaxID=48710 RepID=A0ABP1QMF5_9HEXA